MIDLYRCPRTHIPFSNGHVTDMEATATVKANPALVPDLKVSWSESCGWRCRAAVMDWSRVHSGSDVEWRAFENCEGPEAAFALGMAWVNERIAAAQVTPNE